MLISFSVKNFGCIKDEVTLSFEADKSTDLEDYYIIEPIPGLRLLKLGLIFGPNASGKTTVLKALDFLRGLILEDADSDFSPFLFSEEKESTFFSINFLVHGIRYKYELEINEDEILEEKLFRFNDKKSIVYTRSTDLEKDISHIQFGRKSNIDTANKKTIKDNTLTSQTVMGALNSLNVDASELKGIIKWFKNNLHEIIHPRTNLTDFIGEKIIDELIDKNQIINYLNKADFSINDIIIKETDKKDSNFFGSLFKGVVEGLSGETRYNKKTIGDYMDSRFDEIFFVHKNIVGANTLISYDEESQGTQRYFQFSGLLDLLIRNSVILSIDELESSLHPDLLEHFLLTFLANAKNSQLIATTHSRELLMNKDILRPDVIWFTEKKEDGGTDLFSLDDFDTSVVRWDTGSVYNAYKIGKLGAVPNIGDYYIEVEDGKD